MMLFNKIRKNKKGSIQDVLYLGVIILFAAVVILIGYKIANVFDTNIQANTDMPAEGKTASTKLVGYYPTVIDNSFLFLVIGMSIVTLLMASLVRVHPIFLVFFIIGLVFIIFLCGMFTNIYETMASDPLLSTEAAGLSKIGFIVGKLPFIIGIFGVVLMIIMYKMGENQ